MTTPSERLRAVQWGAQLLEAVAADPSVPPELQCRATEQSLRFPNQFRLLGLLTDRDARFSQDVARELFEAGLLFEAMERQIFMSPTTRQLWRGTMRHYPGRSNGWHRPEDFELFRVGELLELESAIDSTEPSAAETPSHRPDPGDMGE